MRLAWAWIVAVVVCTTRAAAQPTARDEVSVVLVGPDAQVQRLQEVTGDLLRRIPVHVSFERRPAITLDEVITPPQNAQPAVAHVFCDLRRDDRDTLYIVDGPWKRVLVREIARDPGHDEVALEEIGHILETAVEALRSGASIGVAREALEGRKAAIPEPPPPPPQATVTARPLPSFAPPPRRPGARAFELGASGVYGVKVLSPHARPSDDVGLGLWVDGRLGGVEATARIDAAYAFPMFVDAGQIGARREALALRAFVGIFAALTRMVDVRFTAGGGLDQVWTRPVAEAGSITLEPPSERAVPVAAIAVGARYRRLLTFGFGLDIPFVEERYTYTTQGMTEVGFTALAARPLVFVEVELPLLR